jgi:phage gp45-like
MATTQYTAMGTYSHPPRTADVTTQVTWTSSSPAVGTVSSTGLVTPAGIACGTTVITATAGKNLIGPGNSDEVVAGTSTFKVTDPNAPGCQ